MKKFLVPLFSLLLCSNSFAQINLEVDGKLQINQMDNSPSAGSVEVRLPDNTLGVRDISTLANGENSGAAPKYVEDFFSTQPDVFNNFSPTGDSDSDWWPAFARASVGHLSTDINDPYRKQRTYAQIIYVGKSRNLYRLSKTLPAFASFIGLYPETTLNFYNGTNGISIHYPDTWNGEGYDSGSFHGGTDILPTEMAEYEGYGSFYITLKNILLLGLDENTGLAGEGTRGIIVHRRCQIEQVNVYNFGWHGVHISASVDRPLRSNSNFTSINFLQVFQCGWNPGNVT